MCQFIWIYNHICSSDYIICRYRSNISENHKPTQLQVRKRSKYVTNNKYSTSYHLNNSLKHLCTLMSIFRTLRVKRTLQFKYFTIETCNDFWTNSVLFVNFFFLLLLFSLMRGAKYLYHQWFLEYWALIHPSQQSVCMDIWMSNQQRRPAGILILLHL